MGLQNPLFDRLFVLHHGHVFQTLYRLVGNREEAEDLAQETFMRMYNQLDEMDEERVGSWLHRVALNLGLNALRGRKRLRAWQKKASAEQSDAQEFVDPVHSARVRQTLSELSERQVQLLLMHSAGYTYDEIAERAEVSKTSLSQLLSRARRAFVKAYTRQSPKGKDNAL